MRRRELTIVLVAQLDELLLELLLNVLEHLDGLLLGRVSRAEVGGLLGGLGCAA